MNLTLSLIDFQALSPLIVLFTLSLTILLVGTFFEKAERFISLITALGLLCGIYVIIGSPASTNPLLTPWLKFDFLSRFFGVFFLATGIGTTLISDAFFDRFKAGKTEYFFLLVSAIFGLLLISSANDFLTLFLGLETLSIALYVLCCYMKEWSISQEAAIKYFLLGSIATSFLLFGIALTFGAIGSTRFDVLASSFHTLTGSERLLFISGISLVTLGLLFKAAIVPFHAWVPDVYAGSSTPVTFFMAVATKAGAFAALIAIFIQFLSGFNPLWNQVVSILCYATLLYANFVALRQVQLRQFFAYSGISHAGFLLIPLVAHSQDSISAMLFYLVVYAVATLGCFAILSSIDDKSDGVYLKDLKGLFKSSPVLASIFALCLLTLGGIPPTCGFFAKFYIFKVAFSQKYYGLVVVGLLTTILSAFYYLRIVAVMFSEKSDEETARVKSWPSSVAAFCSFACIIVLSCYPGILIQLFS